MKWYFKILGGHTHVRVFMNGGKCGDLCFRNEEFLSVQADATQFSSKFIIFVDETPATETKTPETP